MENILKQAQAQADARIRPFVLTMRYSGLRISDVTVLSVDSLIGDHLRLYTAKTGEPVSILIPDSGAEALRSVSHKNPNISSEAGCRKYLRRFLCGENA